MGEINRNCESYHWGCGGNPEEPAYPREYGPRCSFYGEFFSSSREGTIPDCSTCQKNLESKSN